MDHKFGGHVPECGEYSACPVCFGELQYCTICHCTECELTKECPGMVVATADRDAICDRTLDFVGGLWTKGDRP